MLDDCATQALLILVFTDGGTLCLLLDAIDAACLAIQLHERLASRVLDLEHAARLADAHTLLLGERIKSAARLGGDGIVGAPGRALLLLPCGADRASVEARLSTTGLLVARLVLLRRLVR